MMVSGNNNLIPIDVSLVVPFVVWENTKLHQCFFISLPSYSTLPLSLVEECIHLHYSLVLSTTTSPSITLPHKPRHTAYEHLQPCVYEASTKYPPPVEITQMRCSPFLLEKCKRQFLNLLACLVFVQRMKCGRESYT